MLPQMGTSLPKYLLLQARRNPTKLLCLLIHPELDIFRSIIVSCFPNDARVIQSSSWDVELRRSEYTMFLNRLIRTESNSVHLLCLCSTESSFHGLLYHISSKVEVNANSLRAPFCLKEKKRSTKQTNNSCHLFEILNKQNKTVQNCVEHFFSSSQAVFHGKLLSTHNWWINKLWVS